MIQNVSPKTQFPTTSNAFAVLFATKSPNNFNDPMFTIKTNTQVNPTQYDLQACQKISEFKVNLSLY